ncbi:MAG: site-specific DNA-methyltransferase [Puniceicoccaceae bacterium]|nr:MAG: site-specific DNA-methyltransferase [Puniceicoccaceae bacterium]
MALSESRNTPSSVTHSPRNDKSDYYFLNGEQLIFYSSKTRVIDGEQITALPATNIWDDLLSNNLHKEGAVSFKNGKKPEALLKRILEYATDVGDVVLDSFLGSGTTAAVAHKMGRKWIGVELGDHCKTHCLPRLKRIINGKDLDGISKAVNWQGGGGFRYFKLAESLIKEDSWGNAVINPKFDAELLAEAVCKVEGFRYAPSDVHFWMQGQATETDYIYVTTQSLSRAQLEVISQEVGPERSLQICCGAFRVQKDAFENLTLKKIPQEVLDRCEWNHDDYSLEVENLPAKPKPKGQQELVLEGGEDA